MRSIGKVQEIEILPYSNWSIHELESVQVNEGIKILWDFEIQKDQLILHRIHVHMLISIKKSKNKKTKKKKLLNSSGFYRSSRLVSENKNK